jgi:transcriptional regulator with XRE-family HTH domain
MALGGVGQEPAPGTPSVAMARKVKMSRRESSAGLRRAVAVRTRLRRTELGISQVKFARVLGIPRSYLSRVENEHLLPGPAMLARLAEYLGIDFCSIWEGAESGVPGCDRISTEIAVLVEQLPANRLAQVVARARAMTATDGLVKSESHASVA